MSDDDFQPTIKLNIKRDLEMRMQPIGPSPYVLITIRPDANGELVVAVESGGGLDTIDAVHQILAYAGAILEENLDATPDDEEAHR